MIIFARFSLFSLLFKIIVQNPIIFSCFQPILTCFPPDLSMKYRIFISIVDISANLKNIDIDIDIDKESLENIDIDKAILKNIDIDIDKEILVNIDIDIDIDKEVLENIDIDIDKDILENINIDIDIDKEILENIDIDKISNRLEFGISNRARNGPKKATTQPILVTEKRRARIARTSLEAPDSILAFCSEWIFKKLETQDLKDQHTDSISMTSPESDLKIPCSPLATG